MPLCDSPAPRNTPCQLAKGASPDAEAEALAVAATNGHLKVLEVLHQNGANLEAAHADGQTALFSSSLFWKSAKVASSFFFTGEK